MLVATQTASPHNLPDSHVPDPPRIVETLGVSLSRLVGTEGFQSLLRRALVLAGRDVPSLQSLTIGADGRLDGFEHITADRGADEIVDEEAVALIAHLLELLVTFIGESLTLKLVHESWPEASLDDIPFEERV